MSDFDCKAEVPDWLSKEKWEDVLALSVLPGPLDSLCVDVAINSEQWKEWYTSPYPEKVKLPFDGGKDLGSEDEKADVGTEKNRKDGINFNVAFITLKS